MKRIVVLLLALVLVSSSIALFASNENWVGVSFIGDYEVILEGGGAGISISNYTFDFSSIAAGLGRKGSSTSAYSASIPVYSDYLSVFDYSRRNTSSVLSGDSGRNKIGLMTQVSVLGETIGGFYDVDATGVFTFVSVGMGIRQFLSDDITLYEGVGLGFVFGKGSAYRTVRGQVYDRSYNYLYTVNRTDTGDLSSFGLGIAGDLGVKWDFANRFSLVGGVMAQILWAPTSVSTVASHYEIPYEYNVSWSYDYGYSTDTLSVLIGIQPYIGISFNY